MEDCVLKVYYEDIHVGKSVGGQCFIVESFLITAAHIIDDLTEPYVIIDGEKVQLWKEKALHYKRIISESDNVIVDCAIFALPIAHMSTLRLREAIKDGENLKCFYNSHMECRALDVSDAKVVSQANQFFICSVNPMLYKGCSGCPIMANENEVVGMLIGGDDNNLCVFQSAAFIKHLISHVRTGI